MTTTVDSRTDVEMLETMLLIRAFEDHNVGVQASGQGPGTCTSVGQEASAVGLMRAESIRIVRAG